jgi:hypothetical protein
MLRLPRRIFLNPNADVNSQSLHKVTGFKSATLSADTITQDVEACRPSRRAIIVKGTGW